MTGLLTQLGAATSALIDWASQSVWRRCVLTLAVALITVLPGLAAMPVTDRDEARFAQASKQMIETGDLIDIRFQDQPRWKKPVGIYWLQAASVSVLGGGIDAGIWAYRVPSALAVILAALAMGWAARPLIGPRGAVLSGVMLATTVLAAAEANIAKTDAALMLCAVLTLGALARAMTGPVGWQVWAVFWLAISASILIKGPIVPAIVLLSLLVFWALRRRIPPIGRLRPLPGLALMAVLVAPWVIAIWHISDGAFFAESLGRDMGAKLVSGQEKHWGPPGFYAGIVWGTFWPWAAMIPLALGALWAARREIWLALIVAWIVPFWIMLEIVPTKLPHYVLPIYPALCIAVAWWIVEGTDAKARWPRWISVAVTALPGFGLGLAVIVLPALLESRVVWAALPLAVAGLAATALACKAALSGQRMAQVGASVLAAMALYPAVLHLGLPSLTTAFPSPRMAAVIEQYRSCATGPAYTVGYREPSLVFLTETGTNLKTPQAAKNALADDAGTMVLIEDRWRYVLDEADLPPLISRAELSYFNYNRGKRETAHLVTRDDPRWADCGE